MHWLYFPASRRQLFPNPFPQDYPVTVAVFGFCRTLPAVVLAGRGARIVMVLNVVRETRFP